jgi:hypothetical protein
MLTNVVYDISVSAEFVQGLYSCKKGHLISYCLAGKLWLFYWSLQVTWFLSSYYIHNRSRYRWEVNVKMDPPPPKKKIGVDWIDLAQEGVAGPGKHGVELSGSIKGSEVCDIRTRH